MRPAAYPNVVIVPQEPELGNMNPDEPPPYSTLAPDGGDSAETAKEETSPPRYSELGRSSSSEMSGNGEKPANGVVSALSKIVTIHQR
ncbi:unnamed protein product [Nippostrongylus brasiliensis]|uniref:Uncharacterized protein n=1 Tax=Nippostrongylus brasiliensis TaxID=27835 RepID=A0A0N4XDE7_NIPBR|nr:unnamed protein product [Nippostrongylus brasiliensis]